MFRSLQEVSLTGTIIDDQYKLGCVIGTGGMGQVYEAERLGTNTSVAIKLFHRWREPGAHTIARFHREVQLCRTLEHDNICGIIGEGFADDGTPYLVMPLLKGVSLGELLSKQELPFDRIVDIIAQTLLGLQAAHEKQILHRDLKPDNIFIVRDESGNDSIRILDFGISKYLGDETKDGLTTTGTIPGTPAYMAPEQAAGSKRIDHRSDIYAVGVVLYEALTGMRPFNGDSYNEILFNIVSKPFKAPRVVNPNIPPTIERVILKAMHRNPAWRFESARKMREALLEAKANRDVSEDDDQFPMICSTKTLGNVGRIERHRGWYLNRRKILLIAGILSIVSLIYVINGFYRNNSQKVNSSDNTVEKLPQTIKKVNAQKKVVSSDNLLGNEIPGEMNIKVPANNTPKENEINNSSKQPNLSSQKRKRRVSVTQGIRKKKIKKQSNKSSEKRDTLTVIKDTDTQLESKEKFVNGRFGTRFQTEYGE